MARGGLAGFYDRNKGILQMLAPVAAGALGGPLAGAAVGAAMRGFDRPGQRGIGFDVGQGVIGGVTGYGAGMAGQGLRGLLTGAGAGQAVGQQAMNKAAPLIDAANKNIGAAMAGGQGGAMAPMASSVAAQAPALLTAAPPPPPPPTPSSFNIPSFLKSKEGLAFAGQAATAGANIYGSQQQMALERERQDRERQEALARAELMAMFAPKIMSNLGLYGRG